MLGTRVVFFGAATPKRQSTAALPNVAVFTPPIGRLTFWSAAVLRRFGSRHPRTQSHALGVIAILGMTRMLDGSG